MGPPDANKAASMDDGGGAAPTPGGDGEVEVKTPKITVLRLELATSLKDEAVAHLIEFLQANPNAIEKDISTDMKKYFDQRHGQTWHCIVGKRFGCSIAYDTQFLLFFQADQHYILLFKSAE
uniref:Dynein light chain n=1 Tax=Globisporangium ultimum (strain ATCC 200006 / CBS 805.95 / DAOM BR144) TaxID=431595 RepID=K3WNE9_GLOUD